MQSQTTTQAPPLLDRAFFGKSTCLTIQIRNSECYFKWGKKQGDAWNWKSVKFSDTELGEIRAFLAGKVDKASFYHSFNDQSTKIYFNKTDSKDVLCTADEYTKKLTIGEQEVLHTLLANSIWMMNLS